MPLRLFAYRAVRRGRMVRWVEAKEAKIQPSGYLAMNINIPDSSERRHARGSALNPALFYPSDKLWLFYKVGSDVHVENPRLSPPAIEDLPEYASPLVNDDILPRGPVKINSCWHQMAPGLRRGRLKVLNGGGHFCDRSSGRRKTLEYLFVPFGA